MHSNSKLSWIRNSIIPFFTLFPFFSVIRRSLCSSAVFTLCQATHVHFASDSTDLMQRVCFLSVKMQFYYRPSVLCCLVVLFLSERTVRWFSTETKQQMFQFRLGLIPEIPVDAAPGVDCILIMFVFFLPNPAASTVSSSGSVSVPQHRQNSKY